MFNHKCQRPLHHPAQPTMWCTCFVYSCWAEAVRLRAHTSLKSLHAGRAGGFRKCAVAWTKWPRAHPTSSRPPACTYARTCDPHTLTSVCHHKCQRPLHHPAQPTMWCTCFVCSCWAEAVRLRAHTYSSADAVGLPKRSISQGVKSLNDTGMMPQFGCLAQTPQAPSSSTLEPTFKVARQPDDLCEASKTSASGLSNLTDVAVMSTACRPNPTTSKQFSSHAHGSPHSGTSLLPHRAGNPVGDLRVAKAAARPIIQREREHKDRHDDLSKFRSRRDAEMPSMKRWRARSSGSCWRTWRLWCQITAQLSYIAPMCSAQAKGARTRLCHTAPQRPSRFADSPHREAK